MLLIPFHCSLTTGRLLEPFELQLGCFNPKLVANLKDSLVLRGHKNDDRDTVDVAAQVRFGKWPNSYAPSHFWQGLRRLTRYCFKLAQDLSREKMCFQSCAFLKWSDWKGVKPFSNLFRAASAALLTEFTAAEVRERLTMSSPS